MIFDRELPEFAGKLHGAGEAAWIREGWIVRTSGLGYHPECFEPYTRQLDGKLRSCGSTCRPSLRPRRA